MPLEVDNEEVQNTIVVVVFYPVTCFVITVIQYLFWGVTVNGCSRDVKIKREVSSAVICPLSVEDSV